MADLDDLRADAKQEKWERMKELDPDDSLPDSVLEDDPDFDENYYLGTEAYLNSFIQPDE